MVRKQVLPTRLDPTLHNETQPHVIHVARSTVTLEMLAA